MKRLSLKAPAKINLGLDVLGRREDGYHEVRMIMQTIDLCDELVLEKREEAGIRLCVSQPDIPGNEDNLAYRAAKLLMDEFQIKEGLFIDLQKRIPAAAGLAGGSTDAAAVLKGVNELFDIGLSKEELQERAVAIGADVPYCVMQGTALAEGIGERLTPLPELPECWILIAKPPVGVSTKFVYTALDAEEIKEHPDIDGQIEALGKKELSGLCRLMGNVLETVTVPAYPVIGEIRDTMLACGALNARMSGSGPTVFGIFDDREKAKKAEVRLRAEDSRRQIFLTKRY